jgi:hypothetical protein
MADMTLSAAEKKEVNSCELLIGALSVISIFNIVLYLLLPNPALGNVVVIVATGRCCVFFADFLGGLRKPRTKAGIAFII